jgi:hypothetical protein
MAAGSLNWLGATLAGGALGLALVWRPFDWRFLLTALVGLIIMAVATLLLASLYIDRSK